MRLIYATLSHKINYLDRIATCNTKLLPFIFHAFCEADGGDLKATFISDLPQAINIVMLLGGINSKLLSRYYGTIIYKKALVKNASFNRLICRKQHFQENDICYQVNLLQSLKNLTSITHTALPA